MTNKPRKRAPGGGRKPQGPFANKLATLSTRITPELRRRLDEETAKRRSAKGAAPWSLSQEIELRLRDSLDLPVEMQRQWGPPHIKALAQVISRVVRSVEISTGAGPFDEEPGGGAWHQNPFTHAAVSAAINAILAHYKPPGPIETPAAVQKSTEWIERQSGKELADRQRTPEALGLSCAYGALNQLLSVDRPPLNKSPNEHHASGYYVLPHIRDVLKEPQK